MKKWYKESKPVLGVCVKCNSPIYTASNLNRVFIDDYKLERRRRHHVRVNNGQEVILCNKCNETRIEEEKRENERLEFERIRKYKIQRIYSFIWPSLLFILFLIISIVQFSSGNKYSGIGFLATAIVSYTLLATIILFNTFVPDMFFTILRWNVKFPGIIFSFSWDGFKFLIFMKVLFALIGMCVTIAASIAAFVIAGFFSIFAYPVALIKNIKCIE